MLEGDNKGAVEEEDATDEKDASEKQRTADAIDEESKPEPIQQCGPNGSNVTLFSKPDSILKKPEPYGSDDDT